MAKDVMCEVDACRFWNDGNRCTAERILISSNKEPRTSEATDCKTFEVK